MGRNTPARYLLLASLLALLGVVLLYPIWLTVRGAFLTEDGGFTLYHVLDVLQDGSLRGGLVNALIIATATTILSTILAMPLAMVAPLGLWGPTLKT